MLRTYPDLRFTIDQLVAQDRTVALWATWRGNHHQAGAPLRQKGLVLIRVDDNGRIAERRSTYATLDPADEPAHPA